VGGNVHHLSGVVPPPAALVFAVQKPPPPGGWVSVGSKLFRIPKPDCGLERNDKKSSSYHICLAKFWRNRTWFPEGIFCHFSPQKNAKPIDFICDYFVRYFFVKSS
jgi:hypothetical protein